ncbi:hypothetical protein Barb6_00743 [Bacteroidales bacterium Barb6]|nr:hypothetical protein Barb6_00743 [Bacteroidales bacterium Barb6]
MKNIFILLVLFGCTVFSYAQNDVFPLYGAKWTEVHSSEYEEYFYCYETIGDTIIDGIKRNKLYKTFIDGELASIIGYFDIRDKQVIFRGNSERGVNFCIPANTDILLYDFGLETGDPVSYCNQVGNYPSVISTIDTVKLGKTDRRRFRIAYESNIGPYWIEGMGSTWRLFEPIEYTTTGFNIRLVNFSLNGEVLYYNPDYPEWANGNPQSVAELPSYSPVRIYTDPVSGTFRIVSSGLMNRISVYDTQGRLCKETDCGGEADYSINSKGLPAGVYLVKVQMQNGKEETAKMIIK